MGSAVGETGTAVSIGVGVEGRGEGVSTTPTGVGVRGDEVNSTMVTRVGVGGTGDGVGVSDGATVAGATEGTAVTAVRGMKAFNINQSRPPHTRPHNTTMLKPSRRVELEIS